MVTCPNQDCAREISVEGDACNTVITDRGGLCPIRCAHCGHAGFVAGGTLHLVFRTGQEFSFTVGGLAAYLTILIPADALYACQWLGLAQEALARHAAEWVLLLGYQTGAFMLSPEKGPFVGFTRYMEVRVLGFHPHVA